VTGTQGERDQRQQDITAVVVKLVGIAVAIGLVIGLGAWVMVKALGLSASDSAGPTSGAVQPADPLPTTALPVPSDSASPSAGGVVTGTPSGPASGTLYLTASPLMVQPMERINLTGQWPGHDNESLLVQRFDGGSWTNFGVQVNVNLGTFETYVMTGRTGDQKFRVFDPASNTASNDVTVTIGS
jgi:hypothetical protein